jgi:outer membrane lipoprotein SlyB
MNPYRIPASIVILSAAILGGCASPGYQGQAAPQSVPVASQPYYQSYGTIESIQLVQGAGNNVSNGIGVGTVVGGVVGGLLGNQVGGGRGKNVATVASVIGGAMIGNEMERNSQGRDAYQIGVRFDNGARQAITQDSAADLQVGGRVRVENNRVYRY